MAILIQIRRDTQANWVNNNPILAAGEIAFSTDQYKIKIGDGTSNWSSLSYMTATPTEITNQINAAVSNLIDSAPGTLDTLNELAAALNDDPDFFNTVSTNLSNHESDTTNVHGIADTSLLATTSYVDTAESDAVTSANSYSDSLAVNYDPVGSASAVASDLTDHENSTTNVHGIADTSLLATTSYVDTAESDAITSANSYSDSLAVNYDVAGAASAVASDLTDHENSTTNVHGIDDTSELATKTYADSAAATAVSNLIDSAPETLNTLNELAAALGDDANFATTVANNIATKADASDLTSHENLTTNVHGIVDTALLATTSYVDTAESDAISSANSYSDSLAVNYDPAGSAASAQSAAESYADSLAVNYDPAGSAASAQSAAESYADSEISAHNSDTTDVHGISDTDNLVYTSDSRLSDARTPTSHTHPTSDITNFSENVQDVVGEMVSSNTESGISVSYDDETGKLNFGVIYPSITLTGDVTGFATIPDANGAVITTTIAPDSVSLGTDTTGNYISTISGTENQILVSGPGTEGREATLAVSSSFIFPGTVTLNSNPTQALQAATKQYVDEVAEGLKSRPAVEIATTANLNATYSNGTNGVGATLTANSNGPFPEIDGITLSSITPGVNGVLVKNQSNAAQNGRYNLTQIGDSENPWILTRCGLCDQSGEIPGTYTFVKSGTLNGGTGWVQSVLNPSTFTVGTDSILVVQFYGAGTYTAGTGISLSGTQFNNDGVLSLTGTANQIELSGSTGNITISLPSTINANISGNASTASTVTNGVVTTGSYANPSWITDLSWSKITSLPTTLSGYGIGDAQQKNDTLTKISQTPNVADTIIYYNGNSETIISTTILSSYGRTFISSSDSSEARITLGLSNVENVALSTFSGTSNIISLGTVTSGTWNANVIASNYIDTNIARLNSPTFTGSVILPNSTSIGTVISSEIGYLSGVTSGIQAQLNNKLDSTVALSTYATLASPTFTGTVLLPSGTSIGDVSSTEISYLDGVTSAIQTQLNGKLESSVASTTYAPLDSPSFTTSASLPSNTSIGSVTSTEISYLGGVTSAIQTQINSKSPIESPTFTGTVSGITKSMVGLGNVDNTSDANKPVSTAQQTALDLKANLSGATFTGFVTLHSDPTQATHAATKQYVDEAAEGLRTKPAVEIATTANLTATYNNGTNGVGATLTATSNGAFPTIDGVTLSSTTPGQNGVLVKNQSTSSQNGRYNLTQVGNGSTPWILTRCGLCDEADEIPGAYIFVKQGTLNAGSGWVQVVSNPTTFVVGTDSISVIQFSGAGTITAGTNISVTGTQVSTVNNPTFPGLITASSGVAFSDGTQTKVGVPSISSFVSKTSSYTLDDLTLRDNIIEVNSTSATTVTIPLDSTLNYPIGSSIDVFQINTGEVTIAGASGVTVNATPGLKLRTQWSSCTLLKRAADTWIVYGDLKA